MLPNIAMKTSLRQLIHCLCIVAGVFLSPIANSDVLRPLEIDNASQYPLKGHLSLRQDPQGELNVEQLNADHFQSFTNIPNDLALGFTKDVIWIAFQISNSLNSNTTRWWLEIKQPLFRDVLYYERNSSGNFNELSQNTPSNQGGFHSTQRTPVLQLNVQPGQTKEFLVRISSPTAISAEFILWKPQEFVYKHSTDRFYWGILFGIQLFIVAFFLVFWIFTKERIHLIYAIYISITGLASFFAGAWPFQFFPDLDNNTFYLLMGCLISLIPAGVAIFSVEFLEFHHSWKRHTQKIYALLLIMSAASMTLVMTGENVFAMPIIQSISIALIFLILGVAIYQSLRGSLSAKLYLVAFSIFYFGVILRFLKNMGFVEPTAFNTNSYQIGSFIHMLIMSIGIFLRYNKIKKEKEYAESRLMVERKLRKEQAEFLTIISHEFKTPLSIISVCLENLLKDELLSPRGKERVEKMARANSRLSSLSLRHLTQERLLVQAERLNIQAIRLNDLIQNTLQEVRESFEKSFVVKVHDPFLMIYVDIELLKTALSNLLLNAVQYAPVSTSVFVSTCIEGNNIEIKVRQLGKGIDDKDLPNIFQKFYRGNNSTDTHGNGVGLFIAKTIVQKHNGDITAQNLQEGCEFIVQIPVTNG